MTEFNYILSGRDLDGIYDVLTWGASSSQRSEVLLMLSKPIELPPDLGEIYDDCFLLTLPPKVVDGIVEYAQQLHTTGPGAGPTLSVAVRNGLSNGKANREAN